MRYSANLGHNLPFPLLLPLQISNSRLNPSIAVAVENGWRGEREASGEGEIANPGHSPARSRGPRSRRSRPLRRRRHRRRSRRGVCAFPFAIPFGCFSSSSLICRIQFRYLYRAFAYLSRWYAIAFSIVIFLCYVILCTWRLFLQRRIAIASLFARRCRRHAPQDCVLGRWRHIEPSPLLSRRYLNVCLGECL